MNEENETQKIDPMYMPLLIIGGFAAVVFSCILGNWFFILTRTLPGCQQDCYQEVTFKILETPVVVSNEGVSIRGQMVSGSKLLESGKKYSFEADAASATLPIGNVESFMCSINAEGKLIKSCDLKGPSVAIP